MSPSALTCVRPVPRHTDSLSLYFDGKKLPDDGTVRQYEVEEDDIIDCFRDPRESRLARESDSSRPVGFERVRVVVSDA